VGSRLWVDRAALRLVSAGGSLAFSTGVAEGERLRTEAGLPSPTPGFAAAVVADLCARMQLSPTRFKLTDLDSGGAALRARGNAPVLFAHVGGWKLYYDLSLRRYLMQLWVSVQVVPAGRALEGSGAFALPDRLWSGDCTYRGPERSRPLEEWTADGGALLHEVLREAQSRCGEEVSGLLAGFLETGREQGAFDTGPLPRVQKAP